MSNFDEFLDTFINGDYFLVFLVILFMILVVLVIALIKTRTDYVELLDNREKDNDLDFKDNNDDLLSDLMATSKEEEIDEDKPLIKQIDLSTIKTYTNEINEYEDSEEENAIISAEELSKKTQERIDELGSTSNQAIIDKYEEEQENKAIISYEQLLKNASNISLSYKEEKTDENAPKVNRVEVHSKEVSAPENYLAEEEFLKILKEFRINLE